MLDGVQYFEVSDIFNVAIQRAQVAVAYYEELEMRVSKEYLKHHAEESDTINKQLAELCEVKDGRLKLLEFAKAVEKRVFLDKQLKDRINYILPVELMYKLSSVLFFDENENPETYDFEYNAKKIETFAKHPDFFLHVPLTLLVPYFDASRIDSAEFTTYLKVSAEMTDTELERISKLDSFQRLTEVEKTSLKQQHELIKIFLK